MTLPAALLLGTHALAQTAPSTPLPPSATTPRAILPLTGPQSLERVLKARTLQEGWFAPSLLAQAPLSAIQAQLDGIRGVYGEFQRLSESGGALLAVYEKGTLSVKSALLDEQGRFTSLLLAPGPAQGSQGSAQAPAQGTGQGAAQTAEVAVLTRLFAATPVDVKLFSPAFLAEVPAKTIQELVTNLRAQYGALVSVKAQPTDWLLTFQKGQLRAVNFALDEQGRISGLQLLPVEPAVKFTSWSQARAAFAALGGQVSVLVRPVTPGASGAFGSSGAGAAPLLTLNGEKRLAVASTAKLAILGELQAQVRAGKRRWTDTATLTDADKSLPSGTLQNAKTGSTYTLTDLATRMIRDSDNTATDLLLRVVGRAGVEARLGQQPMFSTRELFVMHDPARGAQRDAYRKAPSLAAKREVLRRLAALPLPDVKVLNMVAPTAPDFEWFATTDRLCTLMKDVAGLPETRQKPGLANPLDFRAVSYKGGSDTGVLQLTTQVTTQRGNTYCVSATWNDTRALKQEQFTSLYKGLLELLKGQ